MNDLMDYYLAIPYAVIDSSKPVAYSNASGDIFSNEVSEPLGLFLVTPIKKFKIFHDDGELCYGFFTVGYKEAITRKKIILNTFKENGLGVVDAYLHDVCTDINPVPGDIVWQVIDLNINRDKANLVNIHDYFYQTKKEVSEKLQNIHYKAKEIETNFIHENIKQNVNMDEYAKQYTKSMNIGIKTVR